jgi:dTDP-4-dehydrorhamnose reductase
MRAAYLVVGGDSLVGAELVKVLENQGHEVIASTRRSETVSDKRIFIDFENQDVDLIPRHIDYVFVVAAATNYNICETDPKSYKTNVELIPEFVLNLLRRKIFVTLVSTNSVFGGEVPWPDENCPHAPTIAYAKQKAMAESNIKQEICRTKENNFYNVVRLTKVLNKSISPLPNWLESWHNNGVIEPFDDLLFAPISLRYAAEGLAKIGRMRISGNFHLSGKENVSYSDLALALAKKLCIERSRIVPVTSISKGVKLLYNPRYSGIGMKSTTNQTGIIPQPLSDVVSDLILELDGRH